MLTVKEAYALIQKERLQAIKCTEYDSMFVFQVVPENFDKSKSTEKLLDSTRSVDKKTGAVRDFKPFYIPIEEYKRGKLITDFNN